MTQSEESITLVTSYRLPHHDSRSFTFVQPDILPFPVIQSFGKNTLRERWKPAMCHKAKNLLLWWRFTVFLTTTADSSHSFSLTFYRSQSFRALARIPCEKGGNQQCAIKRRIYYPNSVLPSSSLRQQILHVRSAWHFTVPSHSELWQEYLARKVGISNVS